MKNIDRNKCGTEYSLCKTCKYEDDIENWSDKCQFCTRSVDVGYGFLLCGVPVGAGLTHLHRNYEPKIKGDANG